MGAMSRLAIAGEDSEFAPGRVQSRIVPPLITLVVMLLFGVSGGLLWKFGYNYDGLSGGAATKIHPSTYVIVIAFLWSGVSYGNPVGFAVRAARIRPGSFLMLVAGVTLFSHIVTRHAPGMAGTIDTFLAPSLFVVLLADLEERDMRRIEIIIHVMMTANALMALIEFVIHYRFFPYRFDGKAFEWDTRSTALHGHPLANAIITAWYVLALINGCRSLPNGLRLPLALPQFAALVVFGGRTGFVVALVLSAFVLAARVHRTLRTGRIPIAWAACAMMLIALLPAAISALASTGFFDTMLDRFSSDGGSAEARVKMFAMFDHVAFRDLLFGPDIGLIESLRRVNGLEWGIENPIINDLLYQGLLITLLVAAAISMFLAEIALLCRRGIWVQVVAFAILINTSESIASKTTMVSEFAVLALCLYRPTPAASSQAIGSVMQRFRPSLPPRYQIARVDQLAKRDVKPL
jgi:hypothetical protein